MWMFDEMPCPVPPLRGTSMPETTPRRIRETAAVQSVRPSGMASRSVDEPAQHDSGLLQLRGLLVSASKGFAVLLAQT
jgi:hypothetical protein